MESRGLRRALVAAQVDAQNYEWWLQFCRDIFPGIAEPKSGLIISLIEREARVRDRLLDGLVTQANTTIVIIDLSDYTASLIRDLYARLGIPLAADPFEVIAQRRLGPEATDAILRYVRDTAIERSAVSRVELLLQEALAWAPVMLPNEAGELIDREALRAMDAHQQREFMVRFSVTFGEALDPRRQADILTRRLEGMRFLSSGQLAFVQLEDTLATDRTFDRGSQPVFEAVVDAHEKMVRVLDHAVYGQFQRPARAGAVIEEDSRAVLGIQVADIAAAVASREYELAAGSVRQKAGRVRATFTRVMVNDEWL